MKLLDDTSSSVHFQAVRGSLKGSKEFMSSHAVGKQVFKETYSSGAEAGAVIGGILVGLLIGILIAAVFRIVRKEPMPDVSRLPASISNPLSSLRTSTNLPSISFHKPKSTEEKKTTSNA